MLPQAAHTPSLTSETFVTCREAARSGRGLTWPVAVARGDKTPSQSGDKSGDTASLWLAHTPHGGAQQCQRRRGGAARARRQQSTKGAAVLAARVGPGAGSGGGPAGAHLLAAVEHGPPGALVLVPAGDVVRGLVDGAEQVPAAGERVGAGLSAWSRSAAGLARAWPWRLGGARLALPGAQGRGGCAAAPPPLWGLQGPSSSVARGTAACAPAAPWPSPAAQRPSGCPAAHLTRSFFMPLGGSPWFRLMGLPLHMRLLNCHSPTLPGVNAPSSL
jgi:hypothetical protein